MPGPPPKPVGQRRRRNAGAKPVALPAAGAKARKAPALPLEGITEGTRAWWKTVWASPMAHAWLDADVPALVRLASLVNRVHTETASASTLAEIRQLEDRYGLSPLARRRLQWEVAQGGAIPTGEGEGRDESRWLRAVDSG
jgi:hypothetical protein